MIRFESYASSEIRETKYYIRINNHHLFKEINANDRVTTTLVLTEAHSCKYLYEAEGLVGQFLTAPRVEKEGKRKYWIEKVETINIYSPYHITNVEEGLNESPTNDQVFPTEDLEDGVM